MTHPEYIAALSKWCDGAHVVEEKSYLQPGYRDGLAGKIELTDERDQPVELPDSSCLMVIEKPR